MPHKIKCEKGWNPMVETILSILTVMIILALGVASLLHILFMRKGNNAARGPFINPIAGGPRHRDGAITYNELGGRRYNIELENPYDQHSTRYRRRHSPKQCKRTNKPWMK